MSDRNTTSEDDRILRSARCPIVDVALGPEGDRLLFRQLRERQQQQWRARAAEASRAFASEAAASAAMATAGEQSSQASSSGAVGSTVAQTLSQSTGVMESQPIVLTSDEIAIQQAAPQEAQLQKALGEIKAEKEKMIRRRARMQRRQADVGELEGMDLTHMDANVRTLRTVLLGVVEMQDHHTALLKDIQQSLALLVGRAKAAPSLSGPSAWLVVQPPPFVPSVTGVSPYVTPASVQAASLGMPLTGGFSAGPSVQVPVQTVFSQPSSQVVISGQPAVSQPAQPQGTQPQQQLVQQPAPQGPQPKMVQVPGQSQWVPKTAIAAPQPFTGDKRGEDLDTWLRNQFAGEANINMHNFPSFSKKALDLEDKIGHGQTPTTDGRKKSLPPNWKAKGLIMFFDNDASTIELDDDFQAREGTEAGSVEASGGGVVAASVQKGKATGRRCGGSRSRSQVDPNAPPWEKAGLTEDVWRDRYTRQACIRCGQYGHNQFKCHNKKVTEKIPPTMGQALGSSAPVGNDVACSSGTAQGNASGQ
ncbi:hypothetical protein CBR_g51252 [Chara braunii]|uniref:Uncharacterized protein n=1 Tax=Chara braunii TaxID=69332 RepID=A0A388M8B2_CHABU|nr:hypothetical protein CBR_g51252 [Chara braunii]|eukprot:GBG90745.1 hypothetical protein CBR_g51252 [Chara braunii]